MFLKRNKNRKSVENGAQLRIGVELRGSLRWMRIFVVIIFCNAFFFFSANDAKAYANSASWISPVKSYVSPVAFGTISWTEVSSTTAATPRPANSSIVVEVRAGNSASPDSSWTDGGNWTNAIFTSTQSLATLGVKKNVQYRITFAYDDLSNMPGVSDVTISTFSGELVSSVYDTKNYGNKVTAIGWTETIAGQSNVLLQMRTSQDNVNWSAWCGPDNNGAGCNSNSWFTDKSGGETIDADFRNSDIYDSKSSDRYIQYKIAFFGDGTNVPIVQDVTFGYERVPVTTSWTSPVKDTGQISSFGNIVWTASAPADTSVSIDIKAGNTTSSDASWTNGGNWTTIASSGPSLSAFSGNRYFQYRINFSSESVDSVPSVSDVTIPYSFYTTDPLFLMHADGTLNNNIITGETMLDSSGNNNNGTISNVNGSAMSYQAGKIAQAMNFDGVDDYISIPASPSLNLASNPVTIEAWIKPAAIGVEQEIFYKTSGYGLKITTTGFLNIGHSGGGNFNGTIPIVAGNWYHVVGVIDGANTKMYVNGQLDPATGSVNVLYSTGIAQIGARATGYYFNGFIDEVAIYNRALSQTEITSQYNLGSPFAIQSGSKIISSPYNTQSPENLLANIKWNEVVPTGTNVKFQMRSAPDNGGAPNWGAGSGWCGPTTCATTTTDTDYASGFYQTDPAGETANPVHKTGNNDQWIQYIVWLETNNSSNAPTLLGGVGKGVTLTYTVNATPVIQNTVSSQGADGKVITTFGVKDVDTTTGNTVGTVIGGLQYCTETNTDLVTANCPDVGVGTKWVSATTPALTFKKANGDILPSNVLNVGEVDYTSYSVVWTPKTDYAGIYNANLKVRVTAFDSAVANATGYGNATIILDTKNPTNVSFTIDHTRDTNNLTLTVPADDLNYQIAYSNYSDFRDVTVFENFPGDNKKTYADLTTDPSTVYIRVKDEKGNYTDATATTPAKPQHVVFYDTSNSISSIYREFIAWDVVALGQSGAGFGSYEVFRAERPESGGAVSSYASIGTPITDRNINFYNDIDLVGTKHYYYKIVTKDSAGNVSQYSTVADDNPNGQGGSDQTPPTISNVRVTNINTTSATVLWDTEEPADSSVGYSSQADCNSAPGNLCPYLPERGVASMIGAYDVSDPIAKPGHSITLTGLATGTTFNIRIKSHDAVGNLGQNDKDNNGLSAIQNFTFTTLPGPAISGVTIPNISNTQATIDWKTTTNSSSYVVYSPEVSNGSLVDPKEFGSPDLVGNPVNGKYSHSQTITTYGDPPLPLISNKTYYFYVKSVDVDGNSSIDNNGSNFYELLTTEDEKPPVISLIATPVISSDSAVVTWTTDEPATSKVSYSTSAGEPYSKNQEVSTYDRGHYIILPNLTANTKYYFKVESEDINGNLNDTSAEQNFTTNKDMQFNHDPLSKIENVSFPENNLRDTTAVIIFTTDQPALCYIDLDTVSATGVASLTKFENGYLEDKKYNVSHAIALSELKALADYSYKLSCHDNIIKDASKTVINDKYSFISHTDVFKTTAQLYTAEGAGALGDSVAPVINNVNVSTVSGESVTVSWDTDEKANSNVRYGVINSDENLAGDPLVNKDSANYITAHSVIVTGLIPATKYIFVASSTDASGNISQSAESSFTTASPSSLSSIKAESKNLGEALITWNTSNDTTSTVEYGLTTSYGEKKESTTLTKNHSIDLSNLNQSVTYHYRVKGQDKDKKLYASSDQTFQPKSPPQITNININDITEHDGKVSFETNIPTTATVIFTNIQDNADNGSQANNEMATKHTIQLKNLTQGATFKISINARDEQGTESIEQASDLTTGKDENPPKIDMVKTDLALAQNDKVQAIISWTTDEQATTSLLYKESRNAEPKEVNISNALTTSHVAVLTIFKPGTVYYFNTKSADASGNTAFSTDYALLTPRRKENIIQIIIANFTEIFGWAQMKK